MTNQYIKRDVENVLNDDIILLNYFEYSHLPPNLQKVSRSFYELAYKIVDSLPEGAERNMALRKLLEAKDCAVRAAL